jgi:hypothetical protein
VRENDDPYLRVSTCLVRMPCLYVKRCDGKYISHMISGAF